MDSGLFLTPSLTVALPDFTVSRDVDTAGALANYVFQFSVPSAFPSTSSYVLTFPSGLVYVSSAYYCNSSAISGPVTNQITTLDLTNSTSVQQIQVATPCAGGCAPANG